MDFCIHNGILYHIKKQNVFSVTVYRKKEQKTILWDGTIINTFILLKSNCKIISGQI